MFKNNHKMPIFDEEWYINEVVGLVLYSNKNKDINRIISKEFSEVFERYFPNLDKSLPCYNTTISLYSYLYKKVKNEINSHIYFINNFHKADDNIYNNILINDDKNEYLNQFKVI